MKQINVQIQFNKIGDNWDFSVVGGNELPPQIRVELSIAANRVKDALQQIKE